MSEPLSSRRGPGGSFTLTIGSVRAARRPFASECVGEAWTPAEAAEAAGCTARTVSKWLRRYPRRRSRTRSTGRSRPRRSPRRVSPRAACQCERGARRLRMPADRDRRDPRGCRSRPSRCGSSGSASASARGSSRPSRPPLRAPSARRARPRRHQEAGRIRGAGHRATRSRASQKRSRREGRLRGVAGCEYVHVMRRRPLPPRLCRSPRGPRTPTTPSPSCAVPIAWFAERGVRVEAVMSDTAPATSRTPTPTRSHELGLRHRRIQTRQTVHHRQGRALHPDILNEWAYHPTYGSSNERTRALATLPRTLQLQTIHTAPSANKRQPRDRNNLARNYS